MKVFLKWLCAVLVGLNLTGCAGLQFDYVRTGTQVEMNGFRPALTTRVMQGVTPSVKAGCPNGVRTDERGYRAERIPADPMIYNSQHHDRADARLKVECVVVSPQDRR